MGPWQEASCRWNHITSLLPSQRLYIAKRIRHDWLPFTRLIFWVNAQNQISDLSRWSSNKIITDMHGRKISHVNISCTDSHWDLPLAHVHYYSHVSRKLCYSLICSQHTCWDDDRCEFPKLTLKTNKMLFMYLPNI